MTTILLRRGSTAQWAAADPVLASGEPGIDTDSGKLKLGDGVRRWSALPYLADNARQSVLAHGGAGDGVTDNWPAFYSALSAAGPGGVVHFPAQEGATTTVYYLSGGGTPDLEGARIAVDPSVVLKMDPYQNVKQWGLLTPMTIENISHGTTITKPASDFHDQARVIAAGVTYTPLEIANDDFTAWAAGTWDEGVLTQDFDGEVTSDAASWSAVFGAEAQLLATPLAVGQRVDVTVRNDATWASGYAALVALPSGSETPSAEWRFDIGSQPVTRIVDGTQTTLPFAGRNGVAYTIPVALTSMSLGPSATLGARLVTAYAIEILINGQLVDRMQLPFACGRVGFALSALAVPQARLLRPVRRAASQPLFQRHVKVAAIGDSITFGALSSFAWPDLLETALAGLPGGGSAEVSANLAISGTYASQWLQGAALSSPVTGRPIDVSGNDYALVMLGANDTQDALDHSDDGVHPERRSGPTLLANALTTIGRAIEAQGVRPVFGLWHQFGSRELSGTGLQTASYQYDAEFRSAALAAILAGGWPVADTAEAIGDNLYWLDDNIHPGAIGHAAIAKAFALALARDNGGAGGTRPSWVPRKIWQDVPASWFSNDWQSDDDAPAQYRAGDEGDVELRGSIVGGVAPSAAFTIPAPHRPVARSGWGVRAVAGGTDIAGTVAMERSGVLNVVIGSTDGSPQDFTSLDGVRWSTV